VLSFSRIPVGAIALGIARGAMESAIEFACRTTMAGKALVNYQEIQLQIAQMMIDTAAMRSMIWQAAGTWKPNQARASMTKVFCSDTAVAVCESAMELLGAHGFLKGNSVEKNYRDARVTQIYEGTNQINRLAVIEDQASWLLEKCENVGGNDNG
jgi:alkylation response protein AidB-like acyl-CoA dehydrogenase